MQQSKSYKGQAPPNIKLGLESQPPAPITSLSKEAHFNYALETLANRPWDRLSSAYLYTAELLLSVVRPSVRPLTQTSRKLLYGSRQNFMATHPPYLQIPVFLIFLIFFCHFRYHMGVKNSKRHSSYSFNRSEPNFMINKVHGVIQSYTFLDDLAKIKKNMAV